MMFVCGLIVLSSAIFSISNIWFSTLGANQEVARQAQRYIDAYEMMLAHDIFRSGTIDTELMEEGINRTGYIQSVAFYNTNEELLFSKSYNATTDQIVRETALRSLKQRQEMSFAFQDGIIHTSPMSVNKELVGYVAVKIPYTATGFSVQNTILWSIGTTCLICALAIPIAMFLVHRITVPLRKLTDFASGIFANQLSN